MTVRFFGLIPRRKDISAEEFHDHYRHPHGTLGLGLTAMRRYVQSHQIHTDQLDDRQVVFEAVAEGWYDTAADGVALAENAHYKAHLLPDEPNFVDLPRLKWLYTRQVESVDRKDTGADLTEAERRWSPEAAPFTVKLLQFLVAEDAQRSFDDDVQTAFTLGAMRYVRSTPAAEVYSAEDQPAYVAVRELWWPTRLEFDAGLKAAQEAWSRLTSLSDGSVSLLAQAERFR